MEGKKEGDKDGWKFQGRKKKKGYKYSVSDFLKLKEKEIKAERIEEVEEEMAYSEASAGAKTGVSDLVPTLNLADEEPIVVSDEAGESGGGAGEEDGGKEGDKEEEVSLRHGAPEASGSGVQRGGETAKGGEEVREEEEEEEEIQSLRGNDTSEEMLTSTPLKNDEFTPSEIAEIDTCSTCSFASSTQSNKRRIRGGKKHNRHKKPKPDHLTGSLERMSDILKEAKLKFGGIAPNNGDQHGHHPRGRQQQQQQHQQQQQQGRQQQHQQ